MSAPHQNGAGLDVFCFRVGGVGLFTRRPSYTTEYLADVATTAAPIVGIAATPRTTPRSEWPRARRLMTHAACPNACQHLIAHRTHTPAAAAPRTRSGAELAAAFADEGVSTVLVEAGGDLTLADSDWEGIPVPVRLSRNFTIRGSAAPQASSYSWAAAYSWA
ncbi:hypothetical protein TSOC_001677 [Tetrabaena socialis]|uniref:Uncharacterized protein n=1 Tax=Tetrabaena socialis TaxID=47790 RepID=A0A2J8AG36_9CHLO|nr:hypothetical protein TSOC_001677 [Tetrabaena socialis]|eukprot:PNH11485.1 hypothetical protein TSOC_001677 [Tetrabaena socialis]